MKRKEIKRHPAYQQLVKAETEWSFFGTFEDGSMFRLDCREKDDYALYAYRDVLGGDRKQLGELHTLPEEEAIDMRERYDKLQQTRRLMAKFAVSYAEAFGATDANELAVFRRYDVADERPGNLRRLAIAHSGDLFMSVIHPNLAGITGNQYTDVGTYVVAKDTSRPEVASVRTVGTDQHQLDPDTLVKDYFLPGVQAIEKSLIAV